MNSGHICLCPGSVWIQMGLDEVQGPRYDSLKILKVLLEVYYTDVKPEQIVLCAVEFNQTIPLKQ